MKTLIGISAFIVALAAIGYVTQPQVKKAASYAVQADPAGPRCFEAIVNAEHAVICRLGAHANRD